MAPLHYCCWQSVSAVLLAFLYIKKKKKKEENAAGKQSSLGAHFPSTLGLGVHSSALAGCESLGCHPRHGLRSISLLISALQRKILQVGKYLSQYSKYVRFLTSPW